MASTVGTAAPPSRAWCRANQADAATERAADVAARVLLPYAPGVRTGSDDSINALVCGGDRSMIDAVLADRRVHPLAPLRHPHLLESAEPRLAVLQDAAAAARRIRIHLVP